MSTMLVAAAVIAVLLFGYLGFALLFPEKLQ